MVLLCQKNSFQKEHKSKVISCVHKEIKENNPNFHIKLEDTIFFPEGGGQRCDKGLLGGVNVIDVFRDGDEAVHVVDKAFEVGEEVDMNIDWEHRLDQMQQHSGQHLLSAIIEKEFGIQTVSWECMKEECNVELDTNDLSETTMAAIEKVCNEKIRQGRKVSVSVFELGDPELDVEQLGGLPKDHKGSIRIIHIDGVDDNMCCGTHVDNLSQLQVIKLLKTYKGKKGKTLLHFIVGNRVIRKLNETYNREKQISTLLNGNPEKHIELLKKSINSTKKLNKNLQIVLKELAAHEIKNIKDDSLYTFIYRKEGDPGYVTNVLREFQNKKFSPESLLVIVTGEKDDGNLLVYRQSGNVEGIGELICDSTILGGAGRVRDNQYSAKLKNAQKYQKADEAIQKYLKK